MGRATLADKVTEQQSLELRVTRNTTEEVRKSKQTKLSIDEVRTFSCCTEKCTWSVEYAVLILARSSFNNLSNKGKNQWVLNYIIDHQNKSDKNILFMVYGNVVCKKAWSAIYSISE
ncbi:uncharacterized protein LOC114541407 [Dendronephthya gigantea]|uniref:uncharacterized protein LOC114541407 n=1 Tax=Dendronephthya gigantea TaxID=151771 RepID=UPI00106A1565|nr:uncharacterized protein LOC114541407 [Dendronephthya gigantea]